MIPFFFFQQRDQDSIKLTGFFKNPRYTTSYLKKEKKKKTEKRGKMKKKEKGKRERDRTRKEIKIDKTVHNGQH